jgi:argininosuccinate synthase
MTRPVADAPSEPEYLEIGFERGLPVSLDGRPVAPVPLMAELNERAGAHGIGRIDMIENRVVGIKSREIYEAPGYCVLLQAHQDLESLTLTADVTRYKRGVGQAWSELVYAGLWHSPLKAALDSFIRTTQEAVCGTVRLRLFKGVACVVGRKSHRALYAHELATYGPGDAFDHAAAKGFISLCGLPLRVWSLRNGHDDCD